MDSSKNVSNPKIARAKTSFQERRHQQNFVSADQFKEIEATCFEKSDQLENANQLNSTLQWKIKQLEL
jgi:hypothetical protein